MFVKCLVNQLEEFVGHACALSKAEMCPQGAVNSGIYFMNEDEKPATTVSSVLAPSSQTEFGTLLTCSTNETERGSQPFSAYDRRRVFLKWMSPHNQREQVWIF